jgi:hypothetical protein
LTRGLRSESTVARTGTTSFPRRVAQKVAQLGGAALARRSAVRSALRSALRRETRMTAGLTAKNMSKNELLERAFRQSFTSPPVMSVQRMPRPSYSNAGPSSLMPAASQAALPRAALPSGY